MRARCGTPEGVVGLATAAATVCARVGRGDEKKSGGLTVFYNPYACGLFETVPDCTFF